MDWRVCHAFHLTIKCVFNCPLSQAWKNVDVLLPIYKRDKVLKQNPPYGKYTNDMQDYLSISWGTAHTKMRLILKRIIHIWKAYSLFTKLYWSPPLLNWPLLATGGQVWACNYRLAAINGRDLNIQTICVTITCEVFVRYYSLNRWAIIKSSAGTTRFWKFHILFGLF